MRRRWRWGDAVRAMVAKLISYLIFIAYSVSILFRFNSHLDFILLDINLLFVDRSVSLLYLPYDSMLCLR